VVSPPRLTSTTISARLVGLDGRQFFHGLRVGLDRGAVDLAHPVVRPQAGVRRAARLDEVHQTPSVVPGLAGAGCHVVGNSRT